MGNKITLTCGGLQDPGIDELGLESFHVDPPSSEFKFLRLAKILVELVGPGLISRSPVESEAVRLK
jgi:hypothetical protein